MLTGFSPLAVQKHGKLILKNELCLKNWKLTDS